MQAKKNACTAILIRTPVLGRKYGKIRCGGMPRNCRAPKRYVGKRQCFNLFWRRYAKLLPAEAIKEITDALKKYGWWQNPCEASIEANPGTVDLPKLKALRQSGFDRISFGVQSLNDAELKAIGRVHNAAEALEAIELAKQAGFKRINADVIYGLPGQTMASLKETLARLCGTGIEHLSVYG